MDKSDAIKRLISRQKTELKTENAPEINLKEWNEKRLEAYLTCSVFGDAILKGGKISDAALLRMLRERQRTTEIPKFSNWAIENGKEYEPIAVAEIAKRYDKETIINGEKVKIIETFPLFNVFKMAAKVEGFGGSLDGEIWAHNLTESGVNLCAKYVTVKGKVHLLTDFVNVPVWSIETKCASTPVRFGEYCEIKDWESLKNFSKLYYYQVIGHLIVSGAQGAIFAAFCPEIYAQYQRGKEMLAKKETLTEKDIAKYTEWSRFKFIHIVELERDVELIQETEIFIAAAIERMKVLAEENLYDK